MSAVRVFALTIDIVQWTIGPFSHQQMPWMFETFKALTHCTLSSHHHKPFIRPYYYTGVTATSFAMYTCISYWYLRTVSPSHWYCQHRILWSIRGRSGGEKGSIDEQKKKIPRFTLLRHTSTYTLEMCSRSHVDAMCALAANKKICIGTIKHYVLFGGIRLHPTHSLAHKSPHHLAHKHTEKYNNMAINLKRFVFHRHCARACVRSVHVRLVTFSKPFENIWRSTIFRSFSHLRRCMAASVRVWRVFIEDECVLALQIENDAVKYTKNGRSTKRYGWNDGERYSTTANAEH